jgi:tRNA threonylcarbamoyladenosine biosynthesis protein TsaE
VTKEGALTASQLGDAAAALARDLPRGAVVWLQGELGAGKTTFAQAFARGRGVAVPVTSPTFTLVHRYDGPAGPLYHVDCYRFRAPDEAADLDWESLTAGDALLVEWPERGAPWVPHPTVRVLLGHVDDPERRTVGIMAGAPA